MQILGSVNKPPKRLFERTFRYLGYSTSWSVGFFLFALYILAAISFLTDALQTANFNWLWLLVSGSAFLPPLAIGVLYRHLFLDKRQNESHPWLNLLVAGFAGSIRNLGVGLLSSWTGLDNSALWSFRAIGGFVLGTTIFTLWAFANGARIEYLSSLNRLTILQSELSTKRNQMSSNVASVNDGLQERTKRALIPQLDSIKELLTSTPSLEAVVDKLRFTIAEQIRPMMKEISDTQPKPFVPKNLRKFRRPSASLPEQFILHDKLRVTWSANIELVGLANWLMVLGSKNGLVDVALMFAIYWAVLGTFKLFLPKGKQFRRRTAIALTIVFALTASVADILYIYFLLDYSYLQFLMFTGFAIISGVIGPLVLMQVTVRNEKRTEIEKQITADLISIAKENSLFAQRLWVFRKRWLLILHGNVQSSLTAALTRLQNAKEVDPVLVELLKQDLGRAEAAVESNLHARVNLANGILELQEVWQGICDVNVTISERAKRALARSDDTAFCVNEILKEAVSNAVRHGDASEADVTIDRITDDVLHVEVVNNGSAPSKKSETSGIGSNLLDEVCLSWKLAADKKGTSLVAELPIRL